MTDVSNQSGQGPSPAAAPAAAPAVAVAPTPTAAAPAPAPAPAAPAPAPAPAEAPKVGEDVAPAPEAPTGVADEAGVVVYDTTGDPGMDMALSFVGKLGLLPEHPAMVKAGEGDFSFIKAHLSSLGDKAAGWEQHIALAEQAWERNVKASEALNNSITSAVHKTAGGEANWTAISGWAKANADPKERETINKLLAAGPVEARAATLMLRQMYEAAGGTTVQPANPLKGATPSADGGGNSLSPLSPKEYGAAVSELNARKPGAVDRGDPEYKQLQQRALAYGK